MRVRRGGLLQLALVAVARVAGAALGIVSAVTTLARGAKPLHPVGTVARAVLTVTPASAAVGAPLLDEPGEHACLVRASYAVGTGPEHTDIEGFALRVLAARADAGPSDLLFASTGVGRWNRQLLALRRPGRHAPQTTLLPIRAAGHPLLFRLDPVDGATQPWPAQYVLSWARGRGPWQRFASLAVSWEGRDDAPDRFDPVANPLSGTTQYAAVARLREPAYRLARLVRPSAGRLPRT